jgi:tetratricopeptide (TPR) repeat protein
VSAERWTRVKRIIWDALEREETERASFLAEACAGDQTLRRDVESLLAAHARAGDFLETPGLAGAGAAGAVALATEQGSIPVAVGQRVGPYRLVRGLGHGGMGVVYLAERADAAFEKQVAIKVVRGGLASAPLMRRFREERRILATLDHPNIARLLDAGTTEAGLPYFVMEYVDGVPLDVYSEATPLSLGGRLLLFRQACSAVQYAHQRLVIHRDLKARNILVTADGTPKLLDFGIAKLLEPGLGPEEQTRTGVRLLSLEGASPEQVRGEPLTVTSDVYALGVLLFRLLTGQSPYGSAHRAEVDVMRAICEEAPLRPSAVAPIVGRRELRGELDWIVLKALRKEPDRRYASVEQLADDIARHLGGRPVGAAPDSWHYRSRRFVGRHRTLVAAGMLLTLSLAGGLAATLWQARRAQEQRARAERRFNDVRKLANAVVGEIHDAIKDLPGATSARKLLVTRAAEYLDGLAGEARGDESLLLEIAAAYAKIGDAQGNPYLANLGEPAAALQSYQKAFAIRAAQAAAHPTDPKLRRDLASSHHRIADMLWAKGQYPEALGRYRVAMGIYEALASADATRLEDRYEVAGVLNKIGQVQSSLDDLPAALETYRRAFTLMSSVAAAAPRSVPYRRGLVVAATKIGDIAYLMHDYETASASHGQAEQMMRDLSRENPQSADFRRSHALLLARVALAHSRLGRAAEAVAVNRETLALQEALATADPENVQIQLDMADVFSNLGEAQSALREHGAAAAAVRRAIAIYERVYARNPDYAAGRRNFANTYLVLGAVLSKTDASANALEAYRKAASLFEVEPVRSEDPSGLAEGYAGLGDASAKLAAAAPPPARAAQWRAARHWFEQSLAIWVALRDQGKLPPDQVDRLKQIEQRIASCAAAVAEAAR